MSDTTPEYRKSFDDELDWTLFDQLHKVVLQISTFCFRTKQICLTVDIAVIGILIKILDNSLDTAIFVAGLIIPVCFWFLDSIAYFYQVKIRRVMNNIQQRLRERNTKPLVQTDYARVIEEKRAEKPTWNRIYHSFCNHSMWLYLFLFIADIVLWVAYKAQVIE